MRIFVVALLLTVAPLSARAQTPPPIESQPLRQLDAWSVSALTRSQEIGRAHV